LQDFTLRRAARGQYCLVIHKPGEPKPKKKNARKDAETQRTRKGSKNVVQETIMGLKRIRLFFAETLRLCAFAGMFLLFAGISLFRN